MGKSPYIIFFFHPKWLTVSVCLFLLSHKILASAPNDEVEQFFTAYCQAVEKFDQEKIQDFYALPSLIAGQSSNEVLTDTDILLTSAQRRLGYLRTIGLKTCKATIVNIIEFSPQFRQAEIDWAFYVGNNNVAIDFKTYYTLKYEKEEWRIVFALDPFENEKLSQFNRAINN